MKANATVGEETPSGELKGMTASLGASTCGNDSEDIGRNSRSGKKVSNGESNGIATSRRSPNENASPKQGETAQPEDKSKDDGASKLEMEIAVQDSSVSANNGITTPEEVNTQEELAQYLIPMKNLPVPEKRKDLDRGKVDLTRYLQRSSSTRRVNREKEPAVGQTPQTEGPRRRASSTRKLNREIESVVGQTPNTEVDRGISEGCVEDEKIVAEPHQNRKRNYRLWENKRRATKPGQYG